MDVLEMMETYLKKYWKWEKKKAKKHIVATSIDSEKEDIVGNFGAKYLKLYNTAEKTN